VSRLLSLRRIPFRSIRAHPVRAVVVLVLALTQAACLFSGLTLVQSIRHELALAEQRLGADLLVYPTSALQTLHKDRITMLGTPVESYQDRSVLSRMDFNNDIESVSYQVYIKGVLPGGETIWIVGYDPQTDFVIAPWLEEGADAEPGDGVVAGSEVLTDGPGTVTLFGRELPVTAHLARTGSDLDRAVMVSMDTLSRLIDASTAQGVETYASVDPRCDYSVALVRLADRDRAESTAAWINTYVRKVTAVNADEGLALTASGIHHHTGVVASIAALAWLVVLVALAVAQSLFIGGRRQELHVWHTIGASRATVERVMLYEALIVHTLGACAGVALAGGLLAVSDGLLDGGGGLTPAWALMAAGTTLLVSLTFGSASTWLTVRRVMRAQGGQELLTA